MNIPKPNDDEALSQQVEHERVEELYRVLATYSTEEILAELLRRMTDDKGEIRP